MIELSFQKKKDLERDMERSQEFFFEQRKEVARQVGQALLEAVQQNIAGSGKVKSWQEVYIGSGGGYAAVRAKAKTFTETKGGNEYAVGRVTNAIDSGHRIRPPSGKSKRYTPRIEKGRVPARNFYPDTQRQADEIAQQAADKLMEAVAAKTEE